jgi:glycosyltransferase EpsH
MKVSIIVPVYNVEKYIDQCLDSLVNQTLKDIEIIIINDGSTDNSQSIINKYVKKYPQKIKSIIKENGGQGSARNLGLEIAKGEYIGFVDSDDYVDLDMYEKMYSKAKKEKSDIVICDMKDHFENGTEKYYDCTNYSNVFLKTPSACNKIFSRKIINNLKFIPNIWYEDFNFTTKILLTTKKISVIHKDFYHCHCREESTMNNNNSLKNLDIITALDDIVKYSKRKKVYDKNMIEYLIFDHILITAINRVSKQNSKDKKMVINKLTNYCRKNISDYQKESFYKEIPRNRKIIAWLNYNGFCNISYFILKIKSL